MFLRLSLTFPLIFLNLTFTYISLIFHQLFMPETYFFISVLKLGYPGYPGYPGYKGCPVIPWVSEVPGSAALAEPIK